MEANEISLDLEYEKRDENGKLEYEGISFVEDEFPAFLKQTISPIYKDEDYNAQMKGNRQIMMRPDIKLPQPFASWSNSL